MKIGLQHGGAGKIWANLRRIIWTKSANDKIAKCTSGNVPSQFVWYTVTSSPPILPRCRF
jgi:hypothetical protein